jgi:hypothetical protein
MVMRFPLASLPCPLCKERCSYARRVVNILLTQAMQPRRVMPIDEGRDFLREEWAQCTCDVRDADARQQGLQVRVLPGASQYQLRQGVKA